MAKYSIFFHKPALVKTVHMKMTKSSAIKKKVQVPPILSRLNLQDISKTFNSSSITPPTRKKENEVKFYSASNFAWFVVLLNEFMMRHPGIESFLDVSSMQSFHKLLEDKFFIWLNYRKNSQKMIYEIKREFMSIAEAILIFELANHQRRLTPFGFVIGPFQKMLELIADENDAVSFGIIPNFRSLSSPPVSILEDTKLHIQDDELRLSGVELFDDEEFIFEDFSHFLDYSQ
jgi:hypothetical protein